MARILGKLAGGLAVLSLAAAPAMAANSAAKLSLRAATESDRDSDLAAGALIALVVVATVIVGTTLAATSDDADSN